MTPKVISSISALLNGCSPSHVSRLIPIVIVDSVKRRAFRFLSNVRDESIEANAPFSAHPDTSTAVVFEVPYQRIIAAFFCVLPSSIFWCVPTNLGVSMSKIGAYLSQMQGVLMSRTATRERAAIKQVPRLSDTFSPAIAPTDPTHRSRRWLFWGLRDDEKAVESAADQRDMFLFAESFIHVSIIRRYFPAGT